MGLSKIRAVPTSGHPVGGLEGGSCAESPAAAACGLVLHHIICASAAPVHCGGQAALRRQPPVREFPAGLAVRRQAPHLAVPGQNHRKELFLQHEKYDNLAQPHAHCEFLSSGLR